MNLEPKGLKIDFEKFERLKIKHWKSVGKFDKYFCTLHGTSFIPEEEPCWSCYDSCTVLSEGGNHD